MVPHIRLHFSSTQKDLAQGNIAENMVVSVNANANTPPKNLPRKKETSPPVKAPKGGTPTAPTKKDESPTAPAKKKGTPTAPTKEPKKAGTPTAAVKKKGTPKAPTKDPKKGTPTPPKKCDSKKTRNSKTTKKGKSKAKAKATIKGRTTTKTVKNDVPNRINKKASNSICKSNDKNPKGGGSPAKDTNKITKATPAPTKVPKGRARRVQSAETDETTEDGLIDLYIDNFQFTGGKFNLFMEPLLYHLE